MSFFTSEDNVKGVFTNIRFVMDESMEVADNTAIQPVPLQQQEQKATKSNSPPVRGYVILNNPNSGTDQLVFISPERPTPTPVSVVQQSNPKPSPVNAITQVRMNQQNMLRTLQSSQTQRMPKNEELARYLPQQVYVKTQNESQQTEITVYQPKQMVDAAVGNDSPIQVDLVESKNTQNAVSREIQTPQFVQLSQNAINRQNFRNAMVVRTPIRGQSPPVSEVHEQITKSDVKLIQRKIPTPPRMPTTYVQLKKPNTVPLFVFMDKGEKPYRFLSLSQNEGDNNAAIGLPGPSTSTEITTPSPRPVTKSEGTKLRPIMRTPCYSRSALSNVRPFTIQPQILQRQYRANRPTYRPANQQVIFTQKPKTEMEKTEIELAEPITQPKEPERKYVTGFLAICPFCGFSNLDFSKCERCKRRLPENVKRQPMKINNQNAETNASNEGNESPQKCPSPQTKKQKKKIEEAIILLSSDEDEENSDKKIANSSVKLNTIVKEPIYTAAEKGKVEAEAETNVPDEPAEPFTKMVMKAFRVGNYAAEARKLVCISSEGIHFTAPSSIYGTDVKVFVKKSSIKAVLIYMHEKESILFIYPSRSTAARIRTLLGVNNEAYLFYDPCSNVQAFRRLILYVERVTEENKIVLSNVLKGLLTAIDETDKQQIMACVHETIDVQSSRSAELQLLSFKGLTIMKSDYACLAEESYLNDVIIDFYMQYLYERKLSMADKARTHIFSSYFYNRLTDNREKETCKEKPAEKRHKRVQKWTRKVNIFEKDFIIIPINENSHWFLAVICFPYLTGPVRFQDDVPLPQEMIRPKNKEKMSVQIGSTIITPRNKDSNGQDAEIILPSSDRDEAEAEDELSETEGDEEQSSSQETTSPEIPLLESPEKDAKVNKAIPIKQPCILIFDSLRCSSSRARVVATLRDYLTVEYKTKMGQDRVFDKANVKGSVLKVPQQDNYSDCGLFVLQYVESFFENPLTDFRLPISYLQYWFGENIHNKRREVAELIKTLMQEQGINPNVMNLPDLQIHAANMSDDIEEDADLDLDEEDEDDEEEPSSSQESNVQSSNIEELTDEIPTTPIQTTQLMMVQKLIPGHGPADGITRQTLKSIRIHRPSMRNLSEQQPELKKLKTD